MRCPCENRRHISFFVDLSFDLVCIFAKLFVLIMSQLWSQDTRFKRTEIASFPVVKSKAKTEDAEHWKQLQQPVTIREYGPVQNVDVCQEEPYFVAVTGSSRVQIFNPLTNSVHKTLSKFRDSAFGGKFRQDGKLLCVGGDNGAVKIFDIASKTLLRTLSGHENATHFADFMDNKRMASFSDDKTVRVWDISTEEQIHCFVKHTVSNWYTLYVCTMQCSIDTSTYLQSYIV